MTQADLNKGQNLVDEINKLVRVEHYFKTDAAGCESKIVEFFTKCGNLGSTSIKKEIAIEMVANIRTFLDDRISKLNQEFSDL